MKAALFGSSLAAIPVAAVLWGAPAPAPAAEVVFACVGKSAGVMRLADAGTTCRSGETLVSWNVQGPQGPQGAPGPQGPAGPQGVQGPAGPQAVANAYVQPDGVVAVVGLPPGATLTTVRTGPGAYKLNVTGLGTACPLASANAFGPAYMYYVGGFCNVGVLELAINSSTGTDVAFMVTVVGVGPATAAAARKPATSSGISFDR